MVACSHSALLGEGTFTKSTGNCKAYVKNLVVKMWTEVCSPPGCGHLLLRVGVKGNRPVRLDGWQGQSEPRGLEHLACPYPRALLAVGLGQRKSSSRVSVRERLAGRNRDLCAWLAHSRGCLVTATLGS